MNIVDSRQSKPLVIFSSPNKNGFTAKNLQKLLALLEMKEYNILNVYDLKIAPCTDCKACHVSACPKQDDFGQFVQAVLSATIIICATPIYFNSVPTPLKVIMDRCQQFFVKKYILQVPLPFKQKAGILLTSSGSQDDFGLQAVKSQINMLFSCLNVTMVSHAYAMNTDNTNNFVYNLEEIQKVKHIKTEEL